MTEPTTDADSDAADRIAVAWQRELPGVPTASIGVITRLWRIGKLLDDERRRSDRRLGLDGATRDLLSTLRRAGPPYRLTPGEIAASVLVSAGAISQRLTRAEREGLVRRSKSPSDGRAVVVELTPAGHRLIESHVRGLLAHEESLLDGLTDLQREQLAGLLGVLLGDLTERFGVPDRA